MSIGKKRTPRFLVGDPVSFLYGTENVAGEIVEDRGPLGDYGRRPRVRPTAWPAMTATAWELADRMFVTRYQDALIEHEGVES